MTNPQATCSIDGCDRSAAHADRGRAGMCSMHYQRLRSRPPCSIEGCEKPVYSGGLCVKHFRRLQAHDDPLVVTNIVGDDAARFASKYEVQPDGCWRWTSPPDEDNYGRFGADGVTYRAHVYAWIQENGPLPEGMTVDHECHNLAAARKECTGGVTCVHRLCVNPAHLIARSIGDNMRASATSVVSVNLAKTHCPEGHEFTEANTLWVRTKRGGWARVCLICKRAHDREWQRRKRTAEP